VSAWVLEKGKYWDGMLGCRGSFAGFECDGMSYVGVAAGEVEVLSIQLELRSGSRYETFGWFAGERCCCAC
jgi:hypothetical protein